MSGETLHAVPVEDWEDALVNTCRGMDGKIRVEYRAGRFHLEGTVDGGPKVSFVPGTYCGVSLQDEEEVRDWLYARYLNPEGR